MKRIHVSLLVCSACLAFCMVSAAPASAQQPHIITFEAPGADTTPSTPFSRKRLYHSAPAIALANDPVRISWGVPARDRGFKSSFRVR